MAQRWKRTTVVAAAAADIVAVGVVGSVPVRRVSVGKIQRSTWRHWGPPVVESFRSFFFVLVDVHVVFGSRGKRGSILGVDRVALLVLVLWPVVRRVHLTRGAVRPSSRIRMEVVTMAVMERHRDASVVLLLLIELLLALAVCIVVL